MVCYFFIFSLSLISLSVERMREKNESEILHDLVLIDFRNFATPIAVESLSEIDLSRL